MWWRRRGARASPRCCQGGMALLFRKQGPSSCGFCDADMGCAASWDREGVHRASHVVRRSLVQSDSRLHIEFVHDKAAVRGIHREPRLCATSAQSAPSSTDRHRRRRSPLATVVQVWKRHVANPRELRLEIEGLPVLLPGSAAVGSSAVARRRRGRRGRRAGARPRGGRRCSSSRPARGSRPRRGAGIRVPLVLLTLGRASCSDTYLARARRHPSRFSGWTP